MKSSLVPQEIIESKIYLIRGLKVMLDEDLAKLYQVSTKRLNEQVKRNIKRFPGDFMFKLTRKETSNLRSQNATSSYGGRRYLSHAFTEQGVAMLSSVLSSERAIQVNIQIMRTFTKIKKIIRGHKHLIQKLNQLENKVEKHDTEIKNIFDAIYKLMSEPIKPKTRIGFRINE